MMGFIWMLIVVKMDGLTRPQLPVKGTFTGNFIC